ncbi:MAG: plasmid pRiA4b ORF-3 family protein [archaeon]|nr:plasmid pRiA4b ORF-3 family protein [archaeon]
MLKLPVALIIIPHPLYTYDFGDNREHTITVEKIMDKDGSQKCPVCIEGECACPPEDCGNMPGYYELPEIQKNKKHPQYVDRIVEWPGEDFNAGCFDVDKVNERLARSDL